MRRISPRVVRPAAAGVVSASVFVALGIVGGIGPGTISSNAAQYHPGGPSRVYGGGRVCALDPSCSNVLAIRDFSVDVHASPGHVVVGDFASSRGGAPVDSADVTCARVQGSKAVIGGFARSPGSAADGLRFVMYFVDSGPPSNPVDDQATPPIFPFFLPGGTFAGEPANFPRTCPDSVDSFDPTFYRALETGDIRVIDTQA